MEEGVRILEAGTVAPKAAWPVEAEAEGVEAVAGTGVANASSAAPALAPGVTAIGEFGCEDTGVPVANDDGRNVASLEGGFAAESADEAGWTSLEGGVSLEAGAAEEEGCTSLEGETSFDAGGERAAVEEEEIGAATTMSALGGAVAAGATASAVTGRGVATTMSSDAAAEPRAAASVAAAPGERIGETEGGETWLRRYSFPASSSNPLRSSSSPSKPSWSTSDASSCSNAASSALAASAC